LAWYVTTIRHHEEGFLLGVEIIHRVLRRDSALDVMQKIRQAGGDFQVISVSVVFVLRFQ
jgi:aubergine-like protein